MENSLIKKINQYFHDEEAYYFSDRHQWRIKQESRLYKDFFYKISESVDKKIKILDIGTGSGLVAYSTHVNIGDFVCTDISYRMLHSTKTDLKLHKFNCFKFVVCDAENLPFKTGLFDITTCNAALHHFPDINKVTEELCRTLKIGGALIIGFESNRKFWTNRIVSLMYRLIFKMKKMPQNAAVSYDRICERVNERLLQEGIISNPLSNTKILQSVDIHSPKAGDRIDYTKGFDIDELINQNFEGFDAKTIYHYDGMSRLFSIYNRLFFPKSAPQFSLILKKKGDSKIKILFLFAHLNYGGAEVGLLTTLKYINRSHFDCIVISIGKKGAIGEEIEKLGFKVIYLDDDARLFNVYLIIKIARILSREKPDILHTSIFYANFFGRLAALFKRPKAIITEERSMYTQKRFYHVFFDRILSTFTDKIIVCSNSVLEFTVKQEKIKKEKFCLIYNVPDTERFDIPETKEELRLKYNFSNGHFILGSVGSLIPKKGHRFLIEAAIELTKHIPELKIVIVGDGESKQTLSSLTEKADLQEKFIFTGARKDVPELMKIMDVFILPSLQEGFPRTLLEAMYIGLPIIATNISGIPEIIINGENGLLIPSKNSKAIEDSVLDIYRDINLRNRLGRNARKTIQSRFLLQNYVNRLEGLYLDLMGNIKEKKIFII